MPSLLPPHMPLPGTGTRPSQKRLRFGSGGTGGPATTLLSGLEKYPLAELLAKDVMANNMPKIALCRSWKERLDTTMLELSNDAITLMAPLTLPLVFRKLNTAFISKVEPELLKKEIGFADLPRTPGSQRLARLGGSFAFLLPFGALFWASPYFRNWMTMKRTGSANFESMIGFDGVQGTQPRRSLDEEMQHQLHTGFKTLAVGFGLGALSLVGLGLAARRVKGKEALHTGADFLEQKIGKVAGDKGKKAWTWFFDAFDLKGKSANQVAGTTSTLLFWAMPAYMGMVLGARSSNERNEKLRQCANAGFWFFFAPLLTKKLWNGQFIKMAAGEAGKVAGNAGKRIEELWKKDFSQAVRNNMLPEDRLNDAKFLEQFRKKVTNLSYKDIEDHFIGSEDVKKKLIRTKNLQFGISTLAIPVTSLSAVQLYNFYATAKNVKAHGGLTQGRTPLASDSTPVIVPATSLPFASSPKGNGEALPPIYSPAYTSYTNSLPLAQSAYRWPETGGVGPASPWNERFIRPWIPTTSPR